MVTKCRLRLRGVIVVFTILPLFSFGQAKPFEIFGTIEGTYSSKMYVFFEGNFRQRDSISSEIKNGKFYLKGKVTMPILARLHLDQDSYIGDIYLDTDTTYVRCTTSINFTKAKDTLNELKVISVKGSRTDKLRSDFESWLDKLKNAQILQLAKNEIYYKKLLEFIGKHPKNRVSPYLLGNAYTLSYSQVKSLSDLIDPSLNKTYEFISVQDLLGHLQKSNHRNIGMEFQNFVLPDSKGNNTTAKMFSGKYMFVVLWASWCKPCRAEHPALNEIYRKYKEKNFEMIGISLDEDRSKWIEAMVKDSLLWKQLIDTSAFEGPLAEYYGIESIPENFLVDKVGKILAVDLTPEELEEKLKEIFN